MLHPRFPIRVRARCPYLPFLIAFDNLPCPALPAFEIPQIAFENHDFFDVVVHKVLDLVACLGRPALEVGGAAGGGVGVECGLCDSWFECFPGARDGGEGMGAWVVVEFELFHFGVELRYLDCRRVCAFGLVGIVV